MPPVRITLVQGRDDETVSRRVAEVARTVAEALGALLSTVRVHVRQIPPQHYAVGDRTRQELDREKAQASPPSGT